MTTKVRGVRDLERRFAKVPKTVRAATKKALKKNAEELTAAQRHLAPVKSGALKRSIGYTFGVYRPANSNVRGVSATGPQADPDLSVTIHAGDDKAYYAAMVEFGTVDHEIKPHKAPALRLHGNRFVERVDHPGAKPTPFFYPPYRAMRKRIKNRTTRAMRKAIRETVSK